MQPDFIVLLAQANPIPADTPSAIATILIAFATVCSILGTWIYSLRKINATLETDKAKAVEGLQDEKSAHTETKSKLIISETTVKLETERAERAERDLKAEQEQSRRQLGQLENVYRRINTLEETQKETKTKINHLESDITRLVAENKQLNTDKVNLMDQLRISEEKVEVIKKERDTLAESNQRLMTTNERLSGQIRNLQEQLDNNSKLIKELQEAQKAKPVPVEVVTPVTVAEPTTTDETDTKQDDSKVVNHE